MNILLDTHTLLWLVSKPGGVDAGALAILSDPGTSVWISAASAWEIATKTRLGRLDGAALLSTWTDVIGDMSSTELTIDSADAILAGRLPWDHRDPFDRIIVAQALRRNLTIATRDAKIIGAAITPTLKA
ncbi:type II toxin-antitoxin system VapC family toxin [Mycolicibacter longobardus]|uniref:Twitching motility protein PilT n=1 Tax=Mycolicibacter longobardus TaxID=1108812 RepID=A0A1X1YE74_9MYCO|nr:type II toxin-antitoxin system VapC family toxin [Mycolicibacter longobardus]MCV7383039.1 type II toxin-antitoxin system VapC family toxin [Mycolicibacter longobardus]ORW09428.1 twitching motility protein PilT [Mycolicibacter longobardus]